MLTNPYLCTQKKYKVRVLFVPKVCEYDKSRKGCNKITPKELEGSFYYDVNANAIDDYDVTIIVGFEEGATAALEAAGYHLEALTTRTELLQTAPAE